MDSKREIPKQNRARHTVDCILEATAQLLQTRSPESVSTNQIAERAGVSIGTLYRYFRNKDEVFDSLVREQAALLVERATSILQDPGIRTGEDLIDRLVDLVLGGPNQEMFARRKVFWGLVSRPSIREYVHEERHKVILSTGQRLAEMEPHRFRDVNGDDLRWITAVWRGFVLSLSQDDPNHLGQAHIKQVIITTMIEAFSISGPAASKTGSVYT